MTYYLCYTLSLYITKQLHKKFDSLPVLSCMRVSNRSEIDGKYNTSCIFFNIPHVPTQLNLTGSALLCHFAVFKAAVKSLPVHLINDVIFSILEDR
jgi:hypothetical protein